MEGITVKTKTESEQIIERIKNKINSLYDILEPVYCDNSKPDGDMEQVLASSKLILDLRNIEYKITQLLDGIRI